MELSVDEVKSVREQEMVVLQEKLRVVREKEQALKDEDGDSDGIEFSDSDSDDESEADRLARLAAA
jgi:hypothetical protein